MASPLEALISFCKNAFNQSGEYQGDIKAWRTHKQQLSPNRRLRDCFGDRVGPALRNKFISNDFHCLIGAHRQRGGGYNRLQCEANYRFSCFDQRQKNEKISKILSPFQKMEKLKLASSHGLKSLQVHNVMQTRRKFSLLSSPSKFNKQIPGAFRINSSMRRWQKDVIPIINTNSSMVPRQ